MLDTKVGLIGGPLAHVTCSWTINNGYAITSATATEANLYSVDIVIELIEIKKDSPTHAGTVSIGSGDSLLEARELTRAPTFVSQSAIAGVVSPRLFCAEGKGPDASLVEVEVEVELLLDSSKFYHRYRIYARSFC